MKIGLLKYSGGGDWYANLETSLKNLVNFTNQNLHTTIDPEQAVVEVGSPELFNYPFVHMTGHGNVMPQSLHGGPGRAGGGEELGGLRALNFYHRRAAIQASTAVLTQLT